MANRSNKTKVSELKTGDIIKVYVPVRINAINPAARSFNGINDGSDLRSIMVTINDGPFKSSIDTVAASADDKFERIMRAKPRNMWERILRMMGR